MTLWQLYAGLGGSGKNWDLCQQLSHWPGPAHTSALPWIVVAQCPRGSLLNFDDLVGFPLPCKDGRLEYMTTPAAVWGAGAVIFDEISRCRPDIQNKLFPIIHERRVHTIQALCLRPWLADPTPRTDSRFDFWTIRGLHLYRRQQVRTKLI